MYSDEPTYNDDTAPIDPNEAALHYLQNATSKRFVKGDAEAVIADSIADVLFDLLPIIQERFKATTELEQRDAEREFFSKLEARCTEIASEVLEATV